MKYRVLLIDDEPSALEGMLLWINWEELGFEVCGTSSNGREGLELIRKLQPDLVITDVNMPLMNGLEMIAAWQQEGSRETKFAIVSGYSEFEYAQTAIRYGISYYLLKPIFPEEAAEELMEIYQELEQETRNRNLNQIASSEEIVTLIKGLLHDKPADQADLEVLSRLSAGKSYWNFCLMQTEPAIYAELRERTASMLIDGAPMFLIDLEANVFGIVYGTHSDEEDEISYVITSQQRDYSKQQVHIALGGRVTSLLRIMSCYQTAKETILHYFYGSEYSGFLSYKNLQNKPFSYHYDQMELMDAMIRSINTLDKSGFSQAVDSAAGSFREMYIAPETVKKIVIHIMYKIIAFTPEGSRGQGSSVVSEIRIPEILDSMISFEGLMNHLLFCGEAIIDIQLNEQNQKSRGIVQEINQYIQEHYRESLTIKQLSEIFFLHPVYLGQLLSKKNGLHFNELLHNLRIEEAARLLRENKLRSAQVAEKVGYSNYSQFLKQFEKKMSMSPNEYRQAKF
ncbi:response regulator transcription factor [Paenibacillus donghaensis]|uniref:DNA-binding response regulator n=1 Tax=Paenibacillus donghaensis TaxID=414771 RepID=A0A2Z2KIP5_9BACL|nr:response regulator [Paenibacillus donghaensis]ASA26094.1 DNA-binding response regulator [Paenibacillus donghaensis]